MNYEWSAGSHFIVFDGTDPSLYCRVEKVMEAEEGRVVLYSWVINGAWNLTVTPSSGEGIIHSPYGDRRRKGLSVVPASYLFGRHHEDYNEVLNYVRDSGILPSNMCVPLIRLRLAAGVVLSRLRRLGPALSAFWAVLVGSGELCEIDNRRYEDGDDGIPF